MVYPKLALSLAVAGLAFAGATSVQAAVIATPTLQQLVDGGTITVGDKLFSNFTYSKSGDMPIASDVNVASLQEPGLWGISFQGAFHDLAGGGLSDATIGYRVTVLDPDFVITDAHLRSNTALLPPSGEPFAATGYISVTESFVPSSGESLFVIYDADVPTVKLVDEVLFAGKGYTTLDVTKTISAVVTSEIGVANISFIDQLFSQGDSGGGDIPEPASLGMLGLGALGLLMRRRRA